MGEGVVISNRNDGGVMASRFAGSEKKGNNASRASGSSVETVRQYMVGKGTLPSGKGKFTAHKTPGTGPNGGGPAKEKAEGALASLLSGM